MTTPDFQDSFRIVIVGRPNVGKSTLFNRLIGRRRALVHDEPGVTRDRIEEKTQWWVQGKAFPVTLVDTGGLGGDKFSDEISHQVQVALKRAQLVLFLFDSQTGLLPLDEELLRELKRSGVTQRIPLIGVVNKVDANSHEDRISDFYSLGLDQVLTLSAEHGRGIDDLQLAIAEASGDFFKNIPKENLDDRDGETDEPEKPRPPRTPRVAIVGRPNVGKSTLINALLQEDRMITSPIAGTTIDFIDSLVTLNDKPFLFMDTAGIRRKNKTEQGVEVLSVVQTKKALEQSDIALLVLDGEEGISEQDEKIGGLIEEVGCSVVLVVNKWDTQRRNVKFTKELAAERIRGKMAYLKYAPMLFISAKQGRGLEDLGSLLEEVLKQRQVKVSTREFTEWVREAVTVNNPMNAKFYMCHQSGRNPPTFVCHVSDPEKIHFSLKRNLINGIRERWGYMGSPVRLLFIEGKGKPGRVLPSKALPRK